MDETPRMRMLCRRSTYAPTQPCVERQCVDCGYGVWIDLPSLPAIDRDGHLPTCAQCAPAEFKKAPPVFDLVADQIPALRARGQLADVKADVALWTELGYVPVYSARMKSREITCRVAEAVLTDTTKDWFVWGAMRAAGLPWYTYLRCARALRVLAAPLWVEPFWHWYGFAWAVWRRRYYRVTADGRTHLPNLRRNYELTYGRRLSA